MQNTRNAAAFRQCSIDLARSPPHGTFTFLVHAYLESSCQRVKRAQLSQKPTFPSLPPCLHPSLHHCLPLFFALLPSLYPTPTHIFPSLTTLLSAPCALLLVVSPLLSLPPHHALARLRARSPTHTVHPLSPNPCVILSLPPRHPFPPNVHFLLHFPSLPPSPSHLPFSHTSCLLSIIASCCRTLQQRFITSLCRRPMPKLPLEVVSPIHHSPTSLQAN